MKIRSMRSRAATAVAASALLTAGLSGTASAAAGSAAAGVPAPHHSRPHPAPYPGAVSAPNPGVGAVLPAPPAAPITNSGAVTATACTPYADGDNAHLSSGDVSGHGWWYQGTCANQKTTVTIYLYEYFSDGTWHWQGTGSAYVWPGGGSANRAVVRQVCGGVALAGWRTLVVVTLGNGASAYTPAQNLNCTHW